MLACRLPGGIAAAAPEAATLESDCSRLSPVSILHMLVTIAGVGHVWPKAPYDAAPGIWRFFAAHPKR